MADSENLNLNIAKSSEYDREQQRLRLDEQKALQTIAELQEQLAIMAEQKEDLWAETMTFGAKKKTFWPDLKLHLDLQPK